MAALKELEGKDEHALRSMLMEVQRGMGGGEGEMA